MEDLIVELTKIYIKNSVFFCKIKIWSPLSELNLAEAHAAFSLKVLVYWF